MLMGGLDEIFGEVTGSGTTSYFTDALGSTVALTDGSGATSAEFTYEPYGKNTKTGSGDTPFRYTGRDDDGTGLYYYRARYYHPQLARFVAEDPIGFAGGINLYAYVYADPISLIDPLGHGGIVGVVVKLFQKGGEVAVRSVDKAGAVAARRAGENVIAETRQMAKQIETAASGGKPVVRHKAHDMADGSQGRPHFQTPGKPGHTFWGAGGAAAVAAGASDDAQAADAYGRYARAVGDLVFNLIFSPSTAHAPEGDSPCPR
jgi:RHS repeat-associated protein